MIGPSSDRHEALSQPLLSSARYLINRRSNSRNTWLASSLAPVDDRACGVKKVPRMTSRNLTKNDKNCLVVAELSSLVPNRIFMAVLMRFLAVKNAVRTRRRRG